MDPIKIKKEVMQVVNIKILILIWISLTSMDAVGQDLTPTNNLGGYTMNSKFPQNNNNEDPIVIMGKVKDLESGKAIPFAKIKYLCSKMNVNDKGEFKFIGQINDFKRNYLVASAMGYNPIRTEFFEVSKKMILKVNFYLEEDKLPLINCEGRVER